MKKMIRTLDKGIKAVKERELEKSRVILEHAADSAKMLLHAFDRIRDTKSGKKGATTDEEQDILRSMLVLASAGLDSMTKQLVRDALPALADRDPKVQQGLETFISRRVRIGEEDNTENASARFIGRLLAARSHRDQAILEYVADLTGGSLQSSEELIKTAYALGLIPAQCCISPPSMKPIFDIRNKIIHELDINFSAPRRRRHSRSRDTMISHTNLLLEVGEKMLIACHEKLAS